MASGAVPMNPGQFGPPFAGGRRRPPGRPDWRRLLVLFTAFVALGAVTATAAAAALVWYGDRRIARSDVAEVSAPGDIDGDGTVDIEELRDVRNVLVVGSDSRDDLDADARSDLGTGDFEGVRTDTLILVQLDPRRESAAMLSFPRDLLVTRCDGTQGRINGAYEIGESSGVGGPNCLVKTINELTGIPVNHYAQVNFQGFVDFVDTLGGVQLYLDQPIRDADAHIDLDAGCQRLNGRQALGFVRVRKIDSDFGRIARQQRFIRELVDQMSSARIALDVPRLFSLVDTAASSVDVDRSLSLDVMRQVAYSFRDLSADRIDARTVPGYNRLIDGVAYVVANDAAAEPLFTAFREGVAAPADLGTEGPSDVKVRDVPPLTVLNGTTTAGLAAAAANILGDGGFEIAGTDNAERQDERRTVVRFSGQRREEANLVAEALGGALVRHAADGDSDAITVVIGADIDLEALERRASEAPTGSPEPEPEPTFAGAAPPPANADC